MGNPKTDDGRERLKVFVATRDGFEIAEADFALRGPGQFFGTEQSGMPELKVADLLKDTEILVEARAAAQALVKRDPSLKQPDHQNLLSRVREVFRGRLDRVDMG
jgi:ATP-dependent DNA helicase RecG